MEYLLFAVVVALLAFIVVLELIHVRERRTMLHAIIARNPSELRSLNNSLDKPRADHVPHITDEEREFYAFGETVGL